jgi:hypothetical protein
VPKVHIKPIKRPKKDSNIESKRQPKCPLVWRTRLSGAPTDSVRCTRDSNSELLTFRNSGSHSAIIHRTVRCDSRATATSAPTIACNSIKCATVRAEVRHAPEGAPDSLQDLSGGPEDRSSNGQNPTAGCRGMCTRQFLVAHRTVRCAMRQQPSPNG